jgi:glycolate oxidase
MALTRDIYIALEDIVGPENISDEPAILDSYAFQWLGEILPEGKGERFVFRPEAVVLPCNTEEVQAIVKACNRYKIKFKAFSTGWGVWGGPGSEGVIQLDLRRMNRILEINEKDMYAVVEPYVISAQLQAELMKRGLNCQIIGGGSSTSAFPLSALDGYGYSSVSTGMAGRNTLGVEMVLPTGEVLKIGSLGSGAGWFSGDGPGPSLRSLVKGITSPRCGVGVFTKAATKVFHWPGPAVSPSEGISPSYRVKPFPEMHTYYVSFPSLEKLSEAGLRIAESEIAYILAAVPEYRLAGDLATNNEEGAKLLGEILESTKGQPCSLIMLIGRSRREFEYQEKVLKEILKETEGEILPLLEDKDIQGAATWRWIRVSAAVRQSFRYAGGSIALAFIANWDCVPNVKRLGREVSQDHIQKGHLLDDGGDITTSLCIENGHMVISGIGSSFDPLDPEARQAAVDVIIKQNIIGLEKYKYTTGTLKSEDNEILGPLQSNYHVWLRKLKKAFDPNVAADPVHYIIP